LLRYLTTKFGGHVSYERVLSGPGLFNVYSFLRDSGFAEEPLWLAEEIKSGDKTAAVAKAALANKSELAVKALNMFVSAYGAMSGNLALLMMATGGLYVGGGIAPKLRANSPTDFHASIYRKVSSRSVGQYLYIILEDKTAFRRRRACS
jgi:glucokinase